MNIKAQEKEKRESLMYWKCKNCGHLIPEIEYLSFVCDMGCPICKTSFMNFTQIIEENEIMNIKSPIKVLIMNGPAESGKGETSKIIANHLKWEVKQYSSIDYVKHVAKEKFGWNGKKNVKGRNLLAGIKQTMIAYNDMPTKKVIVNIQEGILFGIDLMIVDIREPDEIDKLVNWCRENKVTCHTCRVSNTDKELEAERSGLSLTGDRMYGRYDYDIYIYNNKGLFELEQQVKEKFTDVYINHFTQSKKDSPITIGAMQHEPSIKATMGNNCIVCNHGKIWPDLKSMTDVCNYCRQRYIK